MKHSFLSYFAWLGGVTILAAGSRRGQVFLLATLVAGLGLVPCLRYPVLPWLRPRPLGAQGSPPR